MSSCPSFLSIVAVSLVWTSPLHAQRRLAIVPARIDSIVEAYRVKQHVPAVSLYVGSTNGRTIYAKGYGNSRLNPSVAASESTAFYLASISKPFASVTIHRLAEQGLVDLRAPIGKYLPDLPAWRDTITVRHLLSHSSGIVDYTDVPGWSDSAVAAAFVDSALTKPLLFVPGTRMLYSNTNFALVQRIIERVTRQPYPEVLRRMVLEPLGLSHITFQCDVLGPRKLAQGYTFGRPDPRLVPPPAPAHYPQAAAGLCATAPDVARFFSSVLSGKLLAPQSVADLHLVLPRYTGDLASGAGLLVGVETTGEVWSHGGAGKGVNNEAAIWPTDSLMVIVLTNFTDSDAEQLDRAVVRSILNVPKPQVLDLPLTAEALERYVGRYETYNGRILVGTRESRLFAMGERCYYQGEDVFVCGPEGDQTLRFIGQAPKASEAWVLVNGVRALVGVRKTP
jgi:D-alanyl-D-alanine carboxypeptidase